MINASKLPILALGIALLLSPAAFPQEPQSVITERVAAVKRAFAESNAKLRKYEWIETTVLNLKGEDKSTKVKRCYWGDDGVLKAEAKKVVVTTTNSGYRKLGGDGN